MAKEHQAFLRTCLELDCFPDGTKLSAEKRTELELEVASFHARDYPTIPRPIAEAACRVFGHVSRV